MSNSEKEQRMKELGCDKCRYKKNKYMVCETVFAFSDRFIGLCPYFKEKKEDA